MFASVLLMGACSNEEAEEENTESITEETAETTEPEAVEETEQGSLEVDKGLFSVEVTLPAMFFEGEDMEVVIANAEAEGVGEATLNEDGSVTYKMSKSQHQEMMEELEASIDETKTAIVDSGDFPSIKGLEISNDYETYTLQVDREAFENSFDGVATLSIGIVGSYYQAFDGVDSEDMHVEIDLEDADTGEVFQTIVYPEALDEMGE